MKRIIGLILTIVLLLSFASCNGNFAKVDLKAPIDIPENGIIEKSTLDRIKTENAIAAFVGESNAIKYEWLIFGSELKETRDINLSIDIKKEKEGIAIRLSETKAFGFNAMLSIHLNEKWLCDSAKAYENGNEAYNVSVTGSKNTVLNISVNEIFTEFIVLPETEFESDNDESVPDIKEESGSVSDIAGEESDSGSSEQTEESEIFEDSKPDENSKEADSRPVSDGKDDGKDQYGTDPVPEGKPLPIEPEDQEINKEKTYTCTVSIECSTVLNNLSELDPEKLELIPANGVILAPVTVTFYEGESVFDVLARVCKENNIHLEFSNTSVYNSAYIEGIYNLYEFDCGSLSGWNYRVNGWYPNYSSSRYELVDGEVVEWRYSCDLGRDIGKDWIGQQ